MLPCKNFAPSWLVNEPLPPEDYEGQVMATAQNVGYLTAEGRTTTTSGRLPRRVRVRNLLAALHVVAGVSIGSTTAGATDTILVMNSSAASLSVLDMATRKEIRRIPVLRELHHWALTPDRKDLLVGDTVANELLFLDPVTFEIKRRLTMSDPYQLGFSPDGKFFVVAAIARNQIDIYEPVTYRLIKRFNIKSMPSHIDFMPDSSVVFVSLQGTGQVVAIDLRTMLVLWTAPSGKAPAGIMVQNGQVLVANMGADDVAVMDPKDGRVTRRIRTGKGAHTLFRSLDRKTVWVTNRLDLYSVVVLDAKTLEQVRRYQLPGGPDDLEFTSDGQVWFTMRFFHKIAVLDPSTGNHSTIDVGRSPHGIFFNRRTTLSPVN